MRVALFLSHAQLKEKCDDYEQELGVLRARKAVSGVTANRNIAKPSSSPGSDNSDPVSGLADSGRWSDSDGDANAVPKNPLIAAQSPEQDSYDTQQNRNEDILIYIPAIRPPANFSGFKCATTSDTNATTHRTESTMMPPATSNIGKNKEREFSARKECPEENGSRWKYRQRNVSSDVLSEPKPTIIDVYPKKSQSVNAINIAGLDSLHDDDAEDSDERSFDPHVDWRNYPLSDNGKEQNITLRTRTERLQRINRQNLDRAHCNSMGQLHETDDYETSCRLTDSNFLLRSRDSFQEPGKPRSLTHSSSMSDMSCNSNHSGNYAPSKEERSPPLPAKPKNLASSLQSYFFTGSVSKNNAKHIKSEMNGTEPQLGNFPVANLYKKSFIATGHTNCGKYSGSDCGYGPDSSPSNMNKLAHREKTFADKDLGAWL